MNLIDQLKLKSRRRAQEDIQTWQSALRAAENVDNPKRSRLLDIYDAVMDDGQVASEYQKRQLRVTGKKFHVNNSEGVPDPELTKLLKKPWFYEFMEMALDSRFFGHSLIQLGELIEGEISGVELVNRKHVIPQQGLFVFDENDTKGINYRDIPEYWDWLVEIGKPKDLGMLNKCVPHALFNRFTLSVWDEFNELFVNPIRVGKTNTKDTDSINRLEDMMETMSVSSWLIIDKDEMLEFLQKDGSNNGDSFKSFLDFNDAKISKIINGAVIGGDSKGGSRAKEQVGENIGNLITVADLRYIEDAVNHQLIPKLIDKGYPLDGFEFEFEKTKDVEQLWKITEGLMTHKNVDNDFITETFGIPVSDKADTVDTSSELSAQINRAVSERIASLGLHQKKKAVLSPPVFNLRKWFGLSAGVLDDPEATIDEILAVENGQFSTLLFESSRQTMFDSVNSTLRNPKYGTPDYGLARDLEYDVARFAAYKANWFTEAIKNGDDDALNKLLGDFERQTEVEGNHAALSSKAARDWTQYEANKERFPNIEYLSSRSADKRDGHRKYYGMILPVDHAFWKTGFPPIEYNCKCRTRPTRKKATSAKKAPTLPKGIVGNVGIERKVFADTHNYYKIGADVKRAIDDQFQILERNRVKEWAKDNVQGKSFKNGKDKIVINGHGIDRILSQGHAFYWHKNQLIYDLKNVLKKAKLVKSAPFSEDKKGLDRFSQVHYYEIELAGEKSYLVVRELNEKNGGGKQLYSIVDGIQ